MKRFLAVSLVLIFVLTSLTPFASVSGNLQGPTVDWRFQLRALAYPGQPTSPQVVDLDGDGSNEIVVTSAESVYVIRAKGTQKWRYSFDGIVTGAVAADLDSNGEKEVVAVTDSGTVHSLSKEGSHLWSYDTGAAVRATPTLADRNADGRMEIYLGTMKGDLIMLSDQGISSKKQSFPGWAFDRPLIVNPSYTGAANNPVYILTASVASGSKLAALNIDGTTLWSIDTTSAITADIGMGDIDMDGTQELVVPETDALCAHNAFNGTKEWCTAMPVAGHGTSLALADVDGGGKTEAVLGTSNGDLIEFMHDGALGWQGSLNSGVAGVSALMAPELNLMVMTGTGRLEAVDANGLQLWHKDFAITANRTVVAADTDGDSEMELLAVGTDGTLLLLNTHQALKVPWPNPGHDIHNTRNLQATAAGEAPFTVRFDWPDWDMDRSTLLADVDKDGKDEAFGIDSIGQCVLRDSDKGMFQRDLGQLAGAPPLAADLNGDGADELVVGAANNVLAWRGNLLDMWNISLPKTSALAAGDINGDGMHEVFAANQTGHMLSLRGDGGKAWETEAGNFVTSLTIADLGSDGNLELIYTTNQPTAIMYVLNASNGAVKWASDSYVHNIVEPAVADLDGDGLLDILLADDTGDIVAFHGNGTKIWSKTTTNAINFVIATANGMPDGDPGQDVDIVLETGDILIVDGATGDTIRTLAHIASPSFMAQASAAYIGTTEPVIAGYSDYANFPDEPAFFWDDGVSAKLNQMMFSAKATSLVFGDVDGEGLVEMVHGGTVYELGVGPGPTVPWAMRGHDPERTYNPFAKGGNIFPDLTIGPEDIAFDPVVVNGAVKTNVTVTVHNMGPVQAGPFNVTLTKGGTNLTTVAVPALSPFNSTTIKYKWSLAYENSTLDVNIDGGEAVKELRETNNKASRTIFKNLRPAANAGEDVRTDPNRPIILDGTLSKDPDGDIVSYDWDFNDGTTATGAVVSHTFSKSGPFTVALTVTDEYGATGQDNVTVRVNSPPYFLDWRPKANATVNEGEQISFWVMIGDNDGDKMAVTWYLDGTKSAEGTSWTWWVNYSSSGSHIVTASLTDGSLVTNKTWKISVIDSGRLIQDATPQSPVNIPEGQTQEFSVILSQAAQGATITWLLDGHAVQSDTKEFSIFAGTGTQGLHELKLIIFSDDAWDFYYWNVTIGPRKDLPRIRWAFPDSASVTTVLGTPVYLGVSSEGGSVQWYIDGKAQVGENDQSFRFDLWANSTYNVTATVSSGTDSVSRNWAISIEHPPTAIIEADALKVKVGKKVSLDARKSSAFKSTDVLTSYKWDYGDGMTDTGQAVKHAYKKAGGYQVTLTVTDSKGMTATTTATIVVQPEQQATTPGFEGIILFFAMAAAGFLAYRRRKA